MEKNLIGREIMNLDDSQSSNVRATVLKISYSDKKVLIEDYDG